MTVFKESKKALLVNIVAGGMNGALSYTLFAFLNIYLSRYVNLPLEKGLFLNIYGLAAFMSLCPLFGGLSDKLTPRYSILLALILVLTLSPLSFALLQSSEGFALVLGQLILGTLVASFVGPNHAFMQTLFPPKTRYTGIAMGFCIGMAITGGTTPMLLTYLIDTTHNLYMPAFLLMSYAVFSGIVILTTKQSYGEHPHK